MARMSFLELWLPLTPRGVVSGVGVGDEILARGIAGCVWGGVVHDAGGFPVWFQV